MARVDSGGYQPEGLENNPVAEAKVNPGSLAVFSIILPLQTQDTVCIDLVMGKLAHSVEPLTIFNGMLLYEDKWAFISIYGEQKGLRTWTALFKIHDKPTGDGSIKYDVTS